MAEVYATLIPAGEKVELHPRVDDRWRGGGTGPVATQTADDHGTATFEVAPGDYWLVYAGRAVKVVAKGETPAVRRERPAKKAAPVKRSAPSTKKSSSAGRRPAAKRKK
jgi:hypothetical protein